MRAFTIDSFGGEPSLKDLSMPEPGPGQIRIKTSSCGLNFADLLMIQGKYQERPDPPVTTPTAPERSP